MDLLEPSNTHAWALILGVLTPLLTAVAQQPHWSKQIRVAVGVLVALVVGFLNVMANGTLHLDNALYSIALTLVAAQTAYATIWRPAGVAPKIEAKTSRRVPTHRG